MTSMRRLTYSPKVHAYVHVLDQTGTRTVLDISDYIIRGNVHRKINQVSSATLELRNPQKIFTFPGSPTFHPMDPITIYLTRLRGRPVQVFTGYLDSAPYLQLVPDTITLEASCTLKRLMYTYWDAGLPYTRTFLAKYGWQTNLQTGQIFNPDMQAQTLDQTDMQLTDGSIGRLLYATLANVGNWDHNTIFIDKLPSGLVDRVTALYDTINSENEELKASLKSFLAKMIGPGSTGGGGGGSSGGSTGEVHGADRVVPAIGAEAKRQGIPPEFAVGVSIHECRLDPSAQNASGATGYYQWLPGPWGYPGSIAGANNALNDTHKKAAPGSYQKCGLTDSYLFSASKDLGLASYAFCRSAALALKQNPSFKDNYVAWAEYVQGATGQFSSLPGDVDQAKQLVSKYGTDPSAPADGGSTSASQSTGPADNIPRDSGPANNPTSNADSALPHNSKNSGKGSFVSGATNSGPIKDYTQNFCDQLFALGYSCNSANEGPHAVNSLHYSGQACDWGSSWNNLEQLQSILFPIKDRLAELWIPPGVTNHGFYKFGKLGGSDHPAHIHVGLDRHINLQGITPAANPTVTLSDYYTSPFTGSPAPLRTDQGVNFGPSSDIVAIGNATVTYSDIYPENSLGGGGPQVIYRLDDGPLKGSYVYTYEKHTPLPKIKKGYQLKKGEKFSSINSGGSIETGWAGGATGPWSVLTPYGGSPDGTAMPGGKMFARLLRGLGQTTQDDPGAGPVGPGANAPNWDGHSVTGGSVAGQTGVSGNNSTASAFATFLDLPGAEDSALSLMLRGPKSLMNDKPLLPFIQQLSEASLRNFMSLPNGDFYAFFPDYFGSLSHRKPYWNIDPVEIIDGGIDVSDDNLATHVYVVGDTLLASGFGGDDVHTLEMLQSGGVMTIYNAFQAGFVNFGDSSDQTIIPSDVPKSTNILDKAAIEKAQTSEQKALVQGLTQYNANSFLHIFGARPHYEDAPMVRSPYFEAFLAWQRFMLLWAAQFRSKFSFTFMPEVFPGGIVGFQDFDIQCYVEEAIHTFDYEAGFTTQAILSAPASISGNKQISKGLISAGAFDQPTPEPLGNLAVVPKKKAGKTKS